MEKEKQLKEFYFHGLKFIGLYNSSRMFSYYMKQVDDEQKKKLNNTKIDKIFQVTKNVKRRNENDYDRVYMETLISEEGLYRLDTCLGKTKECEEFKDFVFKELLVSLRKAEQETLKEKFDTLEAQNSGLRGNKV